jgi:hypothetical protein
MWAMPAMQLEQIREGGVDDGPPDTSFFVPTWNIAGAARSRGQ